MNSLDMGPGSYHATGGLHVAGYVPGEGVTIGNYCSIAPGVTFLAGGAHRTSLVSTWPFDPKLRGTSDADSRTYKHQKRTQVGHDVWISTGATIMAGVTIGNGAVIGPGAVVFEDVPAYAVVRGNPAKVVRYRHEYNERTALEAIAWWDWPADTIRERVEDFYGSVWDFVQKYRGNPVTAHLASVMAKPVRLESTGIAHPMARKALDMGLHWVTTPDVPHGSDVRWPDGARQAFLDWRTDILGDGELLSRESEISLWLMTQGALLWHPVPSTKTTPGHTVQPTPDMASIDWSGDAMHLGRQTAAYKLLLTRVKGDRLALVTRYYELAGDEPQ